MVFARLELIVLLVADENRIGLRTGEIHVDHRREVKVLVFVLVRQIDIEHFIVAGEFGILNADIRLLEIVSQTFRQDMTERAEIFTVGINELDRFTRRIFDRQSVSLVEGYDHVTLGIVEAVEVRFRALVSDHAGALIELGETVFEQAHVNDDLISLFVIVNDIFLGDVLHLEFESVVLVGGTVKLIIACASRDV